MMSQTADTLWYSSSSCRIDSRMSSRKRCFKCHFSFWNSEKSVFCQCQLNRKTFNAYRSELLLLVKCGCIPVVNIEYSLGRGPTNMAAKIFKKSPLTWLAVTTQHERHSPIMVLRGLVG
jgi:hypothetical protein